jgi:hypothetical protein
MDKDRLIRFENEIYRAQIALEDIEFFTSKENKYLLEESWSYFYNHVFLLQDWLVMKIIRLFDPMKQGREKTKENFVVERLLRESNNVDEWKQVEKKIEKDKKILSDYRNKYLGHYDLDTTNLPSFHKIQEPIKNLMSVLFDVRDILILNNGGNETSREIIRPSHKKINEILYKAKFWSEFEKTEIYNNNIMEMILLEQSVIHNKNLP